MIQLTTAATRVLSEIMQDETAPASVRVGVAKAVLDFALSAVTTTDLMERVEELERIAGRGEESPTVN
jgi:uncharacterized protein (UPF0147 family)